MAFRELISLLLVFSIGIGSATGAPPSDGGDLEDAFSALQDFAKTASEKGEDPAAARLDAAVNEYLKPLEESGIPLESMKEEASADVLKQAASLSAKEILDEDLRISPQIIPQILMLGGIKSSKKLIRNVIERLLLPSDIKRLNVLISGSPIPRVAVTSEDLTEVEIKKVKESIETVKEQISYDKAKSDSVREHVAQKLTEYRKLLKNLEAQGPRIEITMELTVGLLSMVKNVDELAGAIGQAMSRFNPEAYGLSDDPRIYRNLEAISGFKNLEPDFQKIIKADAATTERLVAAGFNPWAVYNFETSALDFLREKYVKRGKYAPIRVFRARQLEEAVKDDLRPIRMQAIKAYITYLSKQKDILENVSHDEKFSSGFKYLQYRLKIYTQSFFSKLTFAVPVAGAVFSLNSMEAIFDAVSSVYVTTKGLIPDTFWESSKESIGNLLSSVKDGADKIVGSDEAKTSGPSFEFPDLTPLIDLPQQALNKIIYYTDPSDFLQQYCSYIVPVRSFVANLPSVFWNRISNVDTQDALLFVSGITAVMMSTIIYKYRSQILNYISSRFDDNKKQIEVEISESKREKLQELKEQAQVPEKIVADISEDSNSVVAETKVNVPVSAPLVKKSEWGRAIKNATINAASGISHMTSYVVLGVSGYTYRKSSAIYRGTIALGPKIVRISKNTVVGGAKLTARLAVGSVDVVYKTALWAGEKYENFAMGSYQLAEMGVIGTYNLGKGIVFWTGRSGVAAVVGIRNLGKAIQKYGSDKVEAYKESQREINVIKEFIKRGHDPKFLGNTLSSLISLYLDDKSEAISNLNLRKSGLRTYIAHLITKWDLLVREGKISLQESKEIFSKNSISRLPVELLHDNFIQNQLISLVESIEANYKSGFEELRQLFPENRTVEAIVGLSKMYGGKLGQFTLQERLRFFKSFLDVGMTNKGIYSHMRLEIANALVEVLGLPKGSEKVWDEIGPLSRKVDFDLYKFDARVWDRLTTIQKIKWDIHLSEGFSETIPVYDEYVRSFKSVKALVESLGRNFFPGEKRFTNNLQQRILSNPDMITDRQDVELIFSSPFLNGDRSNRWNFPNKNYAAGFMKVRQILQDEQIDLGNPFAVVNFRLWGNVHYEIQKTAAAQDAHGFIKVITSFEEKHRDSWDDLFYEYTRDNAKWLFDKLTGDTDTTLEEFKIFWRYLNEKSDQVTQNMRAQVIMWGKGLSGEKSERWNNVYTNHLVKPFFKFNFVKELMSHISTNAKDVQGMIKVIRNYNSWAYSGMARTFHNFIMMHPDLIKNMDDVKAFAEFDAFWPTNSHWQGGELEKPLMKYFAKMKELHPAVWKYEPSMVEQTHHMIGDRLRQLGIYPKDFDGRVELFKTLTNRGVSSLSDELLNGLLIDATPEWEQKLQEYAVEQGRIFEQGIQEEFAIRSVKGDESYKRLRAETSASRRATDLDEVVALLQKRLPSGGLRYVNFLEELSVDILSTQEESAKIHKWKIFPNGQSVEKSDQTYAAVNRVFEAVTDWPKKDQFDFLLFLRGDVDATKLIRESFPTIGPERIRRMYQSLPLAARMAILDMFMEGGLLKGEKLNKGMGLKVIEHLIGEGNSEAQQVARQLLVAFLHALKEVNGQNTALQKTILSYLYAMPKTQGNSIGHTLKHILEVFGATGIKVGQFLVAARILPEKETEILRSLQEKADIPMREDIYADAREILGTDELPFILKQLLGAASLKYAYLATEVKTQREVVIKVFRAGSINHVRTQFALLEKMTEYLIKHHGVKYGLFRSIVNASRRAVEKETEVDKEASKSHRARNFVYIDMSDPKIKVEVPKETLVRDRMLVSQFARGTSLYDLPDHFKKIAAKKILEIENKILFGNQEEIEFDPDRHAGNYRIYFKNFEGKEYLVLEPVHENDETGEISPIDFGQFISIKNSDRQKVIKLFALSQIITRLGTNPWLERQVGEIFSLDQTQKTKLSKSLRRYFPDQDLKDVTPYFALLAAVEEAGRVVDISYPDFIRAIVQLVQYERFAPKGIQTPSLTLEREVRAEAKKYLKDIELSSRQKIKIAAYNTWERVRSSVTGSDYKPIVLDVADLENFQLTRELKTNDSISTHSKLACEGLFR
ncbi:MAG: hypothetical protein A4S09_16955 [Proteobacteria bacterium SG_bin7]|nr:MAG: hypothetical protein A4S09_16955 [Proteobacteria bacterium SG_bin7]